MLSTFTSTVATVVGFTGQSNVLVHKLTGADLPAGYTPSALIQIYNNVTGVVEMYNPGANAGTIAQPGAWGPELGFALRWQQDHPEETLVMVKTAKGSTGLAQDSGELDWSPASTNELFDQASANFANTIAYLQARGVDAKLSTVFVMQGEQDAVNEAKAAAYASNGQGLIAAARAEWGDAATTFVLGKINTAAGLQFDDVIRAAQDTLDLADANTFTVDTLGFGTQAGDLLHFSASGAVSLGNAYYDTYAAQQSTFGTGANEVVFGRGGQDFLHAGDGNDTIFGGDSFDDIHGNTGDDLAFGGNGDDWVVGGQGSDTLSGEAGCDVILGNLGTDSLSGGAGADTIRGGQDSDVINGGSGADWIGGDLGADTITGGSGADTFYFFVGGGPDLITDFNTADGDRILLDPGTIYALDYAGADTILSLAGVQAVTLAGVHVTGTDWVAA